MCSRIHDVIHYFTPLMLDAAGFSELTLRADYEDVEPTQTSRFVVFLARRAG
jgi:hypothetical protein